MILIPEQVKALRDEIKRLEEQKLDYEMYFKECVKSTLEPGFVKFQDTTLEVDNYNGIRNQVDPYKRALQENEFLDSKDSDTIEYGSEFTPVTAKVTDNVDETITNYKPRVYIRYTYPSAEYNTGELYYNNTFNTNIPGYYLAIWDYTDSSGNISNTLKRWVIVSDTTASVIED